MNYAVFNGDADGIIALLQLRLSTPIKSELITGVKRDIELLSLISPIKGDKLTVLDISMEKNIDALNNILNQGAHVFYVDHHRTGDIPEHKDLDAHIDLDANTCTALIIDALLNSQYHAWAIVAAYGDNLIAKANLLAEKAGYSEAQASQLKELGTLINYNGYGGSINDLLFHPADLYRALLAYPCPFKVFEDKKSPYDSLRKAYQHDLNKVLAINPSYTSHILDVFELPDEQWARRIGGIFSNLLANDQPKRAFIVLTEKSNNGFLVSLRAPLDNKQGAGELCSQFKTGGGRAGAAGINYLPKNALNQLVELVENHYG